LWLDDTFTIANESHDTKTNGDGIAYLNKFLLRRFCATCKELIPIVNKLLENYPSNTKYDCKLITSNRILFIGMDQLDKIANESHDTKTNGNSLACLYKFFLRRFCATLRGVANVWGILTVFPYKYPSVL
jgi:thiol-disulfide isomerase/thioredoxin